MLQGGILRVGQLALFMVSYNFSLSLFASVEITTQDNLKI